MTVLVKTWEACRRFVMTVLVKTWEACRRFVMTALVETVCRQGLGLS